MQMIQNGIGDDGGDIRHLFSYNLQRLAGLSSRIAQVTVCDEFGISTLDWRAMAVLDFLGFAPLQVLASRAGVQKSQMSRTVTALERSGYMLRKDNPSDKRSVYLELTPKGKDLVREVLARSRDRNRQMLQDLDEAERKELMRLLGKVTDGTLKYWHGLKHPPEGPSVPEPATAFEREFP